MRAPMKVFIPNPWDPRYNAHSHQVLVMLGLKDRQKIPVEGIAPKIIHGIKVWAEPLVGEAKVGPLGRRWRRSNHRVMAECPICHRVMSAGRLHQHVCKVEG